MSNFSKRKPLTKSGSKSLFKATASKVHKKNSKPTPMRGGIRL